MAIRLRPDHEFSPPSWTDTIAHHGPDALSTRTWSAIRNTDLCVFCKRASFFFGHCFSVVLADVFLDINQERNTMRFLQCKGYIKVLRIVEEIRGFFRSSSMK